MVGDAWCINDHNFAIIINGARKWLGKKWMMCKHK
jgi:hypothetical protein